MDLPQATPEAIKEPRTDTTLTDEDYRVPADLRYALRRFLRVSERHARALGITPQQHLLLLAVRGHPAYPRVTITEIAEHLQLRHNGASLLVERAVQRELLCRREDPTDRRRALVSLTEKGMHVLTEITRANRAELRAMEGSDTRLSTLMEQIGLASLS
ncbi:MAG TPA: MarR family transcriptional regulator [Chloroflexota bacterium]|jgi:DNA-binding MarR family transcriptional regulator|nr:MarR family transcriptional regulator [Chloroflexota bacterium]